MIRHVALALLVSLALPAQTVRVIKFSEAIAFRMGRVTSNRIVHPDMGAKNITLNYSTTGPGDEFAQHTHGDSDDTILILQGAGDMRQGESRRPFSQGQSAWVPGGQIHGTITTQPDTHMISFQTPPDLILYTGARDSSRPGAAPPKGLITPGAIQYFDFAGKNGLFAHPGTGAPRIAAAHYKLRPGEKLPVSVAAGAEMVLFVWKGSITVSAQGARHQAAATDAVFARGPASFEVVSTGESVVIQAQAPPPTH